MHSSFHSLHNSQSSVFNMFMLIIFSLHVASLQFLALPCSCQLCMWLALAESVVIALQYYAGQAELVTISHSTGFIVTSKCIVHFLTHKFTCDVHYHMFNIWHINLATHSASFSLRWVLNTVLNFNPSVESRWHYQNTWASLAECKCQHSWVPWGPCGLFLSDSTSFCIIPMLTCLTCVDHLLSTSSNVLHCACWGRR